MKFERPLSLLLIWLFSAGSFFGQKPDPSPREERPRIRVEARAAERDLATAPVQPQPAPSPRLEVSKADARSAEFSLSAAEAWLEFEASRISFGEIVPGEGVEKPGALMVRVHSERDWELRMVSDAALQVADRGLTVPNDRLQWRTAGEGEYRPLSGPDSVVLASGPSTSPAGHLVVLDLRLSLHDNDPLGFYKTDLSLYLHLDP